MTELARHDLAFCVRRLPRDVKDMMKREGCKLFVAGGFIRSVIANEHINDVDLFTPTGSDADRLAHELAGDRKPYVTGNAYTVTCRKITVQFISRWSFNQPEDAMASFDFTIAKAALWWDANARMWCSACEDSFYADLAAKRLVYTSPLRNEDAGGSMLRVLKFYQRGYRIPLESMGAVIARLVKGINRHDWLVQSEDGLAKVITGLLREVDPLVDPDAEGHVDSVGRPQDVAADPDGEDCPI